MGGAWRLCLLELRIGEGSGRRNPGIGSASHLPRGREARTGGLEGAEDLGQAEQRGGWQTQGLAGRTGCPRKAKTATPRASRRWRWGALRRISLWTTSPA